MKNLNLDLTLRLFLSRRTGAYQTRPIVGSIIGIALSMIPLVVILFLSDGMISGLTNRFIETSTSHIQLWPSRTNSQNEIERQIQKLKGKNPRFNFFEEHNGMGIISKKEQQSGVFLRGISPEQYREDQGLNTYLTLVEGSFDLSVKNHIILGTQLAKELDLKIGDEVKILTGKTLSTGKYIPRVSRFKLVGTVTTGFQDLDKFWAFIPFAKGVHILQDRDSKTIVNVKINDPYNNLTQAMSSLRKDLLPSWRIYSWKFLNRSQLNNYKSTKTLLILIMVLIVLVAIMTISSSMIMLVKENESEIAILKSLGSRSYTLLGQYLGAALLASIVGAFLGLFLGVIISLNFNGLIEVLQFIVNGFASILYFLLGWDNRVNIELLNKAYYLDNFVITIRLAPLINIFLGTVLLSVLGASIPLRKLLKIKPLEIFRKF